MPNRTKCILLVSLMVCPCAFLSKQSRVDPGHSRTAPNAPLQQTGGSTSEARMPPKSERTLASTKRTQCTKNTKKNKKKPPRKTRAAPSQTDCDAPHLVRQEKSGSTNGSRWRLNSRLPSGSAMRGSCRHTVSYQTDRQSCTDEDQTIKRTDAPEPAMARARVDPRRQVDRLNAPRLAQEQKATLSP
jgi:hypothetical protein